MSEPFYRARSEVEIVRGVHRRATLSTGTTFEFGVHAPVKRHFGLDAEPDLPLPVDYIVAATGGWMLGTLNGALAVRNVHLEPGAIRAIAEGINEVRDGVPVLTRIHVHYTLRIPPGTREAVERALSRHKDKCPTACSLRGAVEVDWSADIEESG